MPALLTKISMDPKCWTVSSTSRAQTAASPMSPTSAADLTPTARSFCCVAVGVELEPCTATLAPASAKAMAMAAPNPRDEPVTSADLPLRLKRSSIVSEIVFWEVRGLIPFRPGPRRNSTCLIICERNGAGWRPRRNRLRGEIFSTAWKAASLHYTSTNPQRDACLRETLRFDAGRQFKLRSAMNE